MKYEEFQNILNKKFGASRPADIAKEFNVTPQVVNAWKLKDQVPYKYVKRMRKKLGGLNIVNDKQTSDIFDSDNSELSSIEIVIDFLKELLSKKYHILALSASMMIVFYTHNKFIAEDVYSSESKMIPFRSGESSGIGNLAGQLGINLGAASNVGELTLSSATLVPEVIKCNRVLKKVLFRKFNSEKYDSARTLISILYESKNIPKKWSSYRIQKSTAKLKRNVVVKKSRNSPLIRLYVTANEASLAADINNAIIEEAEKFMGQAKISKISEKKVFISNRLKEVELELSNAEDELKIFREKNRSIISSPALVLQQERLLREVQVQTEVFITLKSQYEITQIDEVNKPQIIEILNYPEKPMKKISPPKDSESILLGLIFGAILGVGLIFLLKIKDEYSHLLDGFFQ